MGIESMLYRQLLKKRAGKSKGKSLKAYNRDDKYITITGINKPEEKKAEDKKNF